MNIQRKIEIGAGDVPYEKLPSDILEAFSAEEATAYQQGPSYFAKKAMSCHYKPLRMLFSKLGQERFFRVHLYAGHQPRFRTYFVFNALKLRLPSGVLPPAAAPAFLRQLYSDVGGFMEDKEYHRGWERPESYFTVADAGWVWGEAGLDPSACVPVFSFGDGDYAGYVLSGGGFRFVHDEGRLREFDLEGFAAEYFADRLEQI